MASNTSKSKPSSKESPTEPFKRAVAGALRALARKPDLEVSYAAERPGLLGGKARLPEPPRKLTKAEAAIVRGNADSIALRIACHDAVVHRKLQPNGQQARAVFEAVEQARVEAIGARRMDGVALNLTAMLDDRFHRSKFDDVSDRADAPIEEALALMVRERLTGLAPPPAARKLVELWRPLIEERAGGDLDRLESLVEDQRQFGDVVHELLESLEMGEDRSSDSEEEDDEGEEEKKQEESGDDGDAASAVDCKAGACPGDGRAGTVATWGGGASSSSLITSNACKKSMSKAGRAWPIAAMEAGLGQRKVRFFGNGRGRCARGRAGSGARDHVGAWVRMCVRAVAWACLR